MPPRAAHYAFLAATMAGASPLGAQGVAVDEVEGAVALDDRTLIVTAPRTPAVLRVDLERGTVTTIGRSGEGPGEYRWPVRPVRLDDGRLGVIDLRGSSVVSWRPDGTAGARRTAPALARPVVAPDGSILGEATQLIATRTDIDAGRDTMPLVQTRPGSGRTDTIGRVTLARRVVVGPFQGIIPDFATDDQWGVLRDGTVWIARARTNHVERMRPGSTRWAASPARRFTAERSTMAERRRLQVRASVEPAGFDQLRQPMADVKAPFTHAVADDNGDVWLRLQPRRGERGSRYAIFPADGSASRTEVAIPGDRLVIAFSPRYIFTKHENDDGEWVLERHLRTALPIRPSEAR